MVQGLALRVCTITNSCLILMVFIVIVRDMMSIVVRVAT